MCITSKLVDISGSEAECQKCDKCLNCEFAYETLANALIRIGKLEEIVQIMRTRLDPIGKLGL
jgi:hypothetical protein